MQGYCPKNKENWSCSARFLSYCIKIHLLIWEVTLHIRPALNQLDLQLRAPCIIAFDLCNFCMQFFFLPISGLSVVGILTLLSPQILLALLAVLRMPEQVSWSVAGSSAGERLQFLSMSQIVSLLTFSFSLALFSSFPPPGHLDRQKFLLYSKRVPPIPHVFLHSLLACGPAAGIPKINRAALSLHCVCFLPLFPSTDSLHFSQKQFYSSCRTKKLHLYVCVWLLPWLAGCSSLCALPLPFSDGLFQKFMFVFETNIPPSGMHLSSACLPAFFC